MLESFLVEGRQDLDPTRPLTYGQSITDACLGWDTTEAVLTGLRDAALSRQYGRVNFRRITRVPIPQGSDGELASGA